MISGYVVTFSSAFISVLDCLTWLSTILLFFDSVVTFFTETSIVAPSSSGEKLCYLMLESSLLWFSLIVVEILSEFKKALFSSLFYASSILFLSAESAFAFITSLLELFTWLWTLTTLPNELSLWVSVGRWVSLASLDVESCLPLLWGASSLAVFVEKYLIFWWKTSFLSWRWVKVTFQTFALQINNC